MAAQRACDTCGRFAYMLPWETTCPSCTKRKQHATTSSQIASGESIETEGEKAIICPWCGEIHDDAEFEPDVLYTEDSHEVSCCACEREFIVSTEVSYYYGTFRKEE